MTTRHSAGRLRFAVAMRGGVSLAVWIGGALHEICALTSASTSRDRLLRLTRFSAVEVDVLTGASAGGLNAAVAGLAAARGADIDMRSIWLELADIDRLLDHTDPPPDELAGRPGPRRSILNGDYFTRSVRDEFGRAAADRRRATPVETFLAATVFDGNSVTDPIDPEYTDRRSEAHFHHRHLGHDPTFSDFDGDDAPRHLATAARASASFPVAFEPVEVALADTQGTLHLDGPPPPDATTVRLYDGGIVDNIPLTRAIHAVADVPADEPVRRWMLFLHPSPDPIADTAPVRRSATVANVLRDFLGAAGNETLLDDLDVLRANNDAATAHASSIGSIAERALASRPPPSGRPLQDGPLRADPLPDVDAHRLYALLDRPDEELRWRPIGQPVPPSPIAAARDEERGELRRGLAARLRAEPLDVRPYARVVRHAFTIIGWIRWCEQHGVAVAPQRRTAVYDVLTVARLLDAALDLATIATPTAALVDHRLEALARLECSSRLHALVDALPCDAAASPLVDRLPADSTARAALVELAAGTVPIVLDPDRSPALADRLRAMLGEVGVALAAITDAAITDDALTNDPLTNDPDDAMATSPAGLYAVLTGHLGSEPTPAAVLDALDRVDVADAGSHRGRAVGPLQPLAYLRISGARSTPLADPSALVDLDLTFTPASGLRQADGSGQMDPAAKLSGNSLANFAAFFSRRFRANDWMWGRLDAASALTEVLVRPGHLAPDVAAEHVRAVLVHDATDPSPIDRLFDAAWTRYGDDVAAELADGSSPLTVTRQLVTLRWQLDILDAELPTVFAAPLEPGDAGDPLPDVPAPGDPSTSTDGHADASRHSGRDSGRDCSPDMVGALAAPWRARLRRYEELDRRIPALWGRRRSVALGVGVVRHSVGAVAPGTTATRRLARISFGAALLVVMSALVHPASFLIGINLLTTLVLIPRTSGALYWLAIVASLAGTATFWWVLVRRAARRPRLTLVASLALHAVIAGRLLVAAPEPVPWAVPRDWLRTDPAPGPGHHPLVAVAVVAVVVVVAALLLWSWARPPWRAAVAIGAGALMAASAAASTIHGGNPDIVVRFATSMWTSALAVVVATTVIALVCNPEDRPRRPAPATTGPAHTRETSAGRPAVTRDVP